MPQHKLRHYMSYTCVDKHVELTKHDCFSHRNMLASLYFSYVLCYDIAYLWASDVPCHCMCTTHDLMNHTTTSCWQCNFTCRTSFLHTWGHHSSPKKTQGAQWTLKACLLVDMAWWVLASQGKLEIRGNPNVKINLAWVLNFRQQFPVNSSSWFVWKLLVHDFHYNSIHHCREILTIPNHPLHLISQAADSKNFSLLDLGRKMISPPTSCSGYDLIRLCIVLDRKSES